MITSSRTPTFQTKVQELTFLIQRFEERLEVARKDHQRQLENALARRDDQAPRSGSLFSSFRRRTQNNPEHSGGGGATSESNAASSAAALPDFMKASKLQAKFLKIQDHDGLIEDLRRISELVVLGENFVTCHHKKQQESFVKAKNKWKDMRDDGLAGLGEPEEEEEEDPEMMDHLELFDLFFERNALESIVGMLTGEVFQLKYPDDNDYANDTTLFHGKFVPPIACATQALQSISIMVQNVSRATSLYVILSNNTMNKLIRLPVHLYSDAVRHVQQSANGSDVNSLPAQTFNSPELSELTTHFVTLLKSLALRMNAETLQFFLKYPTDTRTAADSDEENDKDEASSPYFRRTRTESEEQAKRSYSDEDEDETGPTAIANPAKLEIEFPLYERALDFCAPHQENFVRTTAMNICLNTLRLTTIVPVDKDEEEEEQDELSGPGNGGSKKESVGSSPDGILHNAKALPFHERLAMAQYTCTPSRVERLIAPIFTKLAEKWNSIEENLREIESYCEGTRNNNDDGLGTSRIDKVQKAKEKVRRDRLCRSFQDKAANLQDEMLLLEDLFKVGLTVLNEQAIEMMLATFVYPLLLQPLLLFHQRFQSNLDTSREAFSDHPFRGYSADYGDLRVSLQSVLAPAETSLFTLATVFQCLTNRPLLRLLYTALLHPLSPDATSVPTVRSTLEVATIDWRGQKNIRLDAWDNGGGKVSDDRSSYAFGTTPGNRRLSRLNGPSLESLEGTECCVFVLSPALAEILEYRGEDIALITRTRPNPYRVALLTCLDVPFEMSELTKICVGMFDSAISALDGRFAAEIAFGSDLKRLGDDTPIDERRLDSKEAHIADDRGIGSGPTVESRHTVTRQKGGSIGTDLTGDIVTTICSAVFYASKGSLGSYQLEYDANAAHVLLSLVQMNSRGVLLASKTVETRWRQAATFMSGRPYAVHSPLGGSTRNMPVMIAPKEDDENDEMYGNVANLLFYEAPDDPSYVPVAEALVRLDSEGSELVHFYFGASVKIFEKSTTNDFCTKVAEACLIHSHDSTDNKQELDLGRTSAHSVVTMNGLLSLLKDLAATGGIGLYNRDLVGCALSKDGSIVSLKNSFNVDLPRSMYAPLSEDLVSTIFSNAPLPTGFQIPELGDVVNLVGSPAFPCVCEAPADFAYLFEDADGVVAEGVTWQSLFLVLYHGYLLLAQPNPEGVSGEGRVVSIATCERMHVEHDKEPPTTAARRLILSYRWFDMTAPALFLFDELPEPSKYGPFVKIQSYVSRTEIWFESQKSADAAFQALSMQIFKSKAERGNRLQKFLFPASPYKM